MCANSVTPRVLRLDEIDGAALDALLRRFGLVLQRVPDGAEIPGSHWGAPETGVIGAVLHARADTPVHSILHTAAHYVCMDAGRRAHLHTDCGGTDAEESAVCYLQSLLADAIAGYGRRRLWADMDAWGYSFRLGSAQAWFEGDAADARTWLLDHGLIDAGDRPTGTVRA